MTHSEIKNFKIKELNHIAIIMDGNRRWAIKNNLTKIKGHEFGVKNAINLLKSINNEKNLKIKNITLYIFSKDNWKRSSKEITGLFNLIKNIHHEFERVALEENFRIYHIGSLDKIPSYLRKIILKAKMSTSKNTGMNINLAFNYSGKEEILNAFKKLKNKEKITIKRFESLLYTSHIPDPEIIIRTGGETRLSDFLIWQSTYSDLFFTNVLWPDFKMNNLKKILKSFNSKKSNYGS